METEQFFPCLEYEDKDLDTEVKAVFIKYSTSSSSGFYYDSSEKITKDPFG